MKSIFAKNKLLPTILLIGILLIATAITLKVVRRSSFVRQLRGQQTVESVLEKYGVGARARLKNKFAKAGLNYPPSKIILLGLKAEELLQVYACNENSQLIKLVHSYPIIGTSGSIGPKLREGDGQMPEGFYKISELEPNTPFHVAMRVNYPNEFDKEMGKRDGRDTLGGDIMIHGANCSIGCLAMGDPASEELFVLVHDTGLERTEVLMSPFDFRKPPDGISLPESPAWMAAVYAELKKRIAALSVS